MSTDNVPATSTPAPPADGRWSAEADAVARGTTRLLTALGYAVVREMPLASGRRADLVGLARDGSFLIVEVKSSLADLRADAKWPFYRAHCDRLWFATREGVPPQAFPAECGLVIADAYGATLLREAPEHRIAPATRKAMLVAFGRLAARRLALIGDPDLTAPDT
jgi:hypothetical protein